MKRKRKRKKHHMWKSINSGLEFTPMELGKYFSPMKSLEAKLSIQLSNQNDRWMRKLIPLIKADLYRIHQLRSITQFSE